MVLLHALAGLGSTGFRHRLVVAHFHHQLRGREADLDQELVGRTAESLGVAFVPGTAPVAQETGPSESLENVARRLRHAFLAQTARATDCQRIATGHHADDQAELFFMRLLRGAGSHGLAGMNAVDPSPADAEMRLVRPLLEIPRSDLSALAHAEGLRWREDATNRDTRHYRNRVRHDLIPLLTRHFQPGLLRVVRREQTLLRDQSEYLATVARAWLEASEAREFASQPVALQREILRIQAERHRLPSGFDLIEHLRLHPEAPFQVDAERIARRGCDGRLEVTAPVAGVGPHLLEELLVDLAPDAGQVVFGGLRVEWEIVEAPGDARTAHGGEADGVEEFDAMRIGSVVRLRHWLPGDRFEPVGLGVEARLQDLFTNARIPSSARRRLVLAETESGSIAWVEGLRIGQRACLRGETERRLRWRWRRECD